MLFSLGQSVLPKNISLEDLPNVLDNIRHNLDSGGHLDNFAFHTLFIVYAIIIVVGFCGNILIVLAVLGRKRMRTARNVFIVTLAISDLILCLFTMPSTLWEVRIYKNTSAYRARIVPPSFCSKGEGNHSAAPCSFPNSLIRLLYFKRPGASAIYPTII